MFPQNTNLSKPIIPQRSFQIYRSEAQTWESRAWLKSKKVLLIYIILQYFRNRTEKKTRIVSLRFTISNSSYYLGIFFKNAFALI